MINNIDQLYNSLLKMDNKQDGFAIEEEIVAEEYVEEQEMEAQNEVSQESEVDQLLPLPAFHIEEDHQNLTQDEKDAFTYILSVRNQKQAILKCPKKKIQISNTTNSFEIIKPHFDNHISQDKAEQFLRMIHDWKCESVQNWRLVVQNLKYLQKNTEKANYFKEKLHANMMSSAPQAYKLCLNKTLNLSQIEKFLVQFSNSYYEKLENSLCGQSEVEKCNYHLWIYSLLALHQSYASYTNFQALASINAVIEKEILWFQHRIKQSDLNDLSIEIMKWLVNLILLIEIFNQKYLKKNLHLVRKWNII